MAKCIWCGEEQECRWCGKDCGETCIDAVERDRDKRRIRDLEDSRRRITEHGKPVYNSKLMDVMAVLARRNKNKTIEIPMAEFRASVKTRAAVSIEQDDKVLRVRAV